MTDRRSETLIFACGKNANKSLCPCVQLCWASIKKHLLLQVLFYNTMVFVSSGCLIREVFHNILNIAVKYSAQRV